MSRLQLRSGLDRNQAYVLATRQDNNRCYCVCCGSERRADTAKQPSKYMPNGWGTLVLESVEVLRCNVCIENNITTPTFYNTYDLVWSSKAKTWLAVPVCYPSTETP